MEWGKFGCVVWDLGGGRGGRGSKAWRVMWWAAGVVCLVAGLVVFLLAVLLHGLVYANFLLSLPGSRIMFLMIHVVNIVRDLSKALLTHTRLTFMCGIR